MIFSEKSKEQNINQIYFEFWLWCCYECVLPTLVTCGFVCRVLIVTSILCMWWLVTNLSLTIIIMIFLSLISAQLLTLVTSVKLSSSCVRESSLQLELIHLVSEDHLREKTVPGTDCGYRITQWEIAGGGQIEVIIEYAIAFWSCSEWHLSCF